MKKIFIIFIITLNIIYANDNYELKLYEKILPTICKTDTIKVFADNKVKKILQNSNRFVLVENCNDATILIGKYFSDLSRECRNKPIFTTTYQSFKNNSNSFGAFYWRKGRPQIKFRLEVIEKYNLNLSKELKKYAQ